jgi:hypothetical protein
MTSAAKASQASTHAARTTPEATGAEAKTKGNTATQMPVRTFA